MAFAGRQSVSRFSDNTTVHQYDATGTPVNMLVDATLGGKPTSVLVTCTNLGANLVYISPLATAASGMVIDAGGGLFQPTLIELGRGAGLWISETGTPAETINMVFMYD